MENQFKTAEPAGVDITAVSKEELTDVSGFSFDIAIPKEQRAVEIFQKIKNPYCFRMGDMGVKLEFLNNVPSLQDCLINFLQRKKSGL